jgi:hypothetical protein
MALHLSVRGGLGRPAVELRYAGFVLYNIAPTMSSTRKIGSKTGGTSHSRKLNGEDFGI